MRRKLWLCWLVIGVGILFQVVFWKTDNLYVGIMGYALFIAGNVMIPLTNNQEKKKVSREVLEEDTNPNETDNT